MIAQRLFVAAYDAVSMQPMTAVTMTVSEAFEQWTKETKPIASGLSMIGNFARMFPNLETRKIEKGHVDRYRLERSKKLQASSVKTELARLSGFLKWMRDGGLIAEIPRIVWPRSSSKSPPVLSQDDIKRLLATIREHSTFEPFYLLALCGLRRSEILRVEWEHVNRTDRTVAIPQGKTRSSVAIVPLFGPIVEWIESRPAARGFLVEIPKTMARTGVTFRALFDRWNRAHPDEQLPNPHRCRHTIATELLRGGAPLVAVQKLLRHASPVITERIYGHVDAVHFRDAIDAALPRGLGGLRHGKEVEIDPVGKD